MNRLLSDVKGKHEKTGQNATVEIKAQHRIILLIKVVLCVAEGVLSSTATQWHIHRHKKKTARHKNARPNILMFDLHCILADVF